MAPEVALVVEVVVVAGLAYEINQPCISGVELVVML